MALAFVVAGAGLIVAGLALAWLPLAVIAGGVALVLLGVFAVETGD